MADGTYKAPEGYLTLAEARVRLGVAKATITRMANDGRLPTFEHPRDRRVRLVRIEDVEDLQRPTISLEPILASWQDRFEQTDEQLADYLEMRLGRLPSLRDTRLKTIPGKGGWRSVGGAFPDTNDPSATDLQVIATRLGANPIRLFDVFMGEKESPEGKAAA